MSKSNSEGEDKPGGERIWQEQGLFNDVRGNLSIGKIDYLEDPLFYMNVVYPEGENIIYVDYFILGQIISALNAPVDLESYVCAENEVKFTRSLYDLSTGEFKVIGKTIAYIMVTRDENETF